MTTIVLPDAVKKIGLDKDLGKDDWSKSLQRVIQTAPNGTAENPTIIRVPELYRSVSSIEPYRTNARYIHIICDEGGGFHFPTLGIGEDDPDIIAKAIADPRICDALRDKYRDRFGLGPVGGHGWKFHGILKGPKKAGMPLRSPSGTTSKSRNCLEAQHAFWGKDFGYELTIADIANGVHGWDICGATITGWWGDAFSPGTTIPNTPPAREMHVFGGKFDDLGRMGMLVHGVRGWSCRNAEFGPRIPSSIIHVENASTNDAQDQVGDGVFERNVLRGGANLFHVTGEFVNFDGLLIRANERFDSCVGGRIMVGARKADGTARARNIQVIDNLHHTIRDGMMLGDYVNADHVQHQRNVGPQRKGWSLSQLLRTRGGKNNTLSPNAYTYVPR